MALNNDVNADDDDDDEEEESFWDQAVNSVTKTGQSKNPAPSKQHQQPKSSQKSKPRYV